MNLRAPIAEGQTPWIEVSTPHYVLSTDLPEPQARNLAHTLEEARAALLALAWSGAHEPPRGRTDVVAFLTPAEFDRHSGRSAQLIGVSVVKPGRAHLIGFSPGPGGGLPRVVVHELVHDLSRWFMPIQPPWFAEGLAVYLENTTFDRGAHRALLGEESKSSVEWLRHTKTLWSSSILFEQQSGVFTDPHSTSTFYASSWFFVDYLLNEQGQRFGEFERRLAHLEPWKQAWQAAFAGITPDQLDEQELAHNQGRKYALLDALVEPEAFEPKLRSLSEAEVHGVWAQFAEGSETDLARQEVAEALRLDPMELNALAVSFFALPDSAANAKLELARRAVSAHPNRAAAWALLALAEPPGDERSAAIERAYRLDPTQPSVLGLKAEQEIREGHAKEALPYTRLALQRSAPTPSGVLQHIEALAANQRCPEAAQLEANAEVLFAKNCTFSSERGQQTCPEYFRDVWSKAQRACVSPALRRVESAANR